MRTHSTVGFECLYVEVLETVAFGEFQNVNDSVFLGKSHINTVTRFSVCTHLEGTGRHC